MDLSVKKAVFIFVSLSAVASFCFFVYYSNNHSVSTTGVLQRPAERINISNATSVKNQKKQSCSKNCGYVTLRMNGRYGNHLFYYAMLYGLAKKSCKHPFMLKGSFKEIFSNFQNLSIPVWNKAPNGIRLRKFDIGIKCKNRKDFPRCMQNAVEKTKTSLRCGLSYDIKALGAYNWRYFDDYRADVLNEFSFTDQVQSVCQNEINQALHRLGKQRESCLVIGVHMRRGDKARTKRKRFATPATMQYVRNAMNYFDSKLKDDDKIYIFVGEEEDWNRASVESSRLNKDVVILPTSGHPRSPDVDLCILTRSDHVIASTGTFSWWAAYLTEGIATRQSTHGYTHDKPREEYPRSVILPM